MSNADPARTFIEVMYKTLDAEIAQGDCAKALQSLNTFIGAIADNSPSARKTFGSNLMVMYATRAKLRCESGDVEAANADVQNALDSLEAYYDSVDPNEKELLRNWIALTVSPEAQLRSQAMSNINKWRGLAPRGGGAPQRSSAGQRPSNMPAVQQYVIPFITGAVIWAIPFIVIGLGAGSQSSPVITLGLILVVVPYALSFMGWGWLSQARFGTYGWLLKAISLFLICCTVFGMVFPALWAGRRLLQMVRKD